MKIEIAGIYWPEANVGNFSFISFLPAYLRFSEVELSQNETIIVSKMVSSKFLYMKNVH